MNKLRLRTPHSFVPAIILYFGCPIIHFFNHLLRLLCSITLLWHESISPQIDQREQLVLMRNTRFLQFSIDVAILVFAFLLAAMFRFDWVPPQNIFKQLVIVLPWIVLLEYCMIIAFGVPQLSWRYIGMQDAARILFATSATLAILVPIRFIAPLFVKDLPHAKFGIVPLGVLLINAVLMFLGIAGVRVLRRLVAEKSSSRKYSKNNSTDKVPTLLIGAGQGGVLVAQEISRRPDLGIQIVAFVDDDPSKHGTMIHGIKVAGSTTEIAKLASKFGAKQALLTISSAPGNVIRTITEKCKDCDLTVKIVPGTHEIVGGRINLSRIRDVAIEDLLRRRPVKLDTQTLANFVKGKTVLITGAGGSIGSELCRQIDLWQPEQLVLVERAENNLFHIHRELRQRSSIVKNTQDNNSNNKNHTNTIVPVVADVTDIPRMEQIFATYRPQVVFHAAAHKHVPMMEWNPGEAIKNNIVGTKLVASLADKYATKKFVMVSTDKAVNPTSIMGTTKRVAELYIQLLSKTSETCFSTVRFGNVLGSAGSVIPIFTKQIEAGGPVTVTDPNMQRYFYDHP